MPEVAAELSRLLGRKVDYQQRSFGEQRQTLIGSGVSEFVATIVVGLDKAFYQSALREDTSTVQFLTGHAPRTLTHWLSDNLSLFQREAGA